MKHELPELPYAMNALEPHISKETLEYHYGKHHRAYVTKLNELIEGTDFFDAPLDDIILNSSGALFNNAAQVWNHTFYWHSLSPKGGGAPKGDIASALNEAFESFTNFQQKFTQAALTRFGSGWAWLVQNTDNSLEIVTTSNAENPMTDGQIPVITCDVWEHAYYIDTRNDRAKYLANFWQLVNWDFANQNYSS